MKKLLILGVVAIMMSFGMVLASCDLLFGCPGGAFYAATGECYATLGVAYDQCTDNCITDQAISYSGYGTEYKFDSDKYCTCHFEF